MVEFRARPADSAEVLELLTEYFHSREITFARGSYRVVFPDPTMFVPPAGVFLVVDDTDAGTRRPSVGCGGVRRIADAPDGAVRFEIKHLFMRESTRGRGLGRALLAELERRAIGFGAREIVLDTNATLVAAGSLYRSSGYADIEPYNDNPNATHWFAKRLERATRAAEAPPRGRP
ncbi:GNAT family N-acetyltransferase [Galbitalea sp. SE-J8]|uniref:GNAT family N-acetyltransferase n=1 Tax=Galbitalea sp. SE-J8 TaxID=3054952 RepID=UPI00259D09F9|nr:GNAT family N-acetyltransferase [Galbitalea sp. SE-J8]MDM4762573.1 GNAT family N-acetyltransferase [Galbitalea sp. SE-J8]